MSYNLFISCILVACCCLAIALAIYAYFSQPFKLAKTIHVYDWWIILALMLVYGALAFINLGQWPPAQGMWFSVTANKTLNIQFKQPTMVKEFYYYLGLSNGILSIDATDAQNKKLHISTLNTKDDYSFIYKWQALIFTQAVLLKNISITALQPTSEIKQLALFGPTHNYLTNFTTTTNQAQYEDNLTQLVSPITPTSYYFNWRSNMVTDETYYATSAYQYLHGYAPIVTVHPPLAMLITALGIFLCGMNTIGWRIMSVICGILLIPIIYLFTKRLFNQHKAATIASLLLSFDFMHYGISRMALLEAQVTLFSLTSYYLLYNYLQAKKYGCSFISSFKYLVPLGIALGCTIASKWSGLFSLPLVFGVICYCEICYSTKPEPINLMRRLIYYLFFLIIIPLAIYILSYLPLLHSTHANNLLQMVVNYQFSSYHFHTVEMLHKTSGMESPWWSWPLLLKPLGLAIINPDNLRSISIVLIGNPAIWWLGILAFLYLLIRTISKPSLALAFLSLSLCCQYLPYALIQRPEFLYYFYNVTPLMIIAISYLLTSTLKRDEKALHYLVYFYLVLVVFLFICFFPALASIEVNRLYVYKYLVWYNNWNF